MDCNIIKFNILTVGTGKTTIARRVLEECNRFETKISFFSVSLAVLLDGNTGNNLSKLFDAVSTLFTSFGRLNLSNLIQKEEMIQHLQELTNGWTK